MLFFVHDHFELSHLQCGTWTIKGGLHRGLMDYLSAASERGCNRSGLKALLISGNPGSVDFGRFKVFDAEFHCR